MRASKHAADDTACLRLAVIAVHVPERARDACKHRPPPVGRCRAGGSPLQALTARSQPCRKSLLKKKPPLYRVLLHNDNMNRREYVVQALIKVVDGMTMEDAIQV